MILRKSSSIYDTGTLMYILTTNIYNLYGYTTTK